MYKKLFHTLLIVVPVAVAAWFMVQYGKTGNTFYGDAQGYYMYLPATFIYHNHTAGYQLPRDKDIPSSVIWYVDMMQSGTRTAKGHILNQYTYGVALMEAPFFFIAHSCELLKGGNANGYSTVYENAIKLSSVVYCLLGLFIIYRILRRYFSTTVSLLSTSFIFIGTNLFWFTVYQAGMAHEPLFFLYALLILLTVKAHEQPALSRFMLVGFVAGIITLIRPTDIICLLIPLLYNVYSRKTLTIKKDFLFTHRKKIFMAALCFIIPILPQLFYWKMMTGRYVVYSYGSQGFNWDKPKIIAGLFHFSNGWIPYSPIMIFSLAGLFFMKKVRQWAWATWLLFPIYVYIIYSWYCYNYINGLGSRPMIHLYPLLSIPLAIVIGYIAKKGVIIKTIFTFVCLFFIALNISYSMQRAVGVLNSEESNFEFNAQMLFRMHLRYNDLVTLDIGEWQPNASVLEKAATLKCENYEHPVDEHYVPDTTGKSSYVYHMLNDEHHPNTLHVIYNRKKFGGAHWLKCSGRFMVPEGPKGYFKHLFVLSIDHNGSFLKWCGMKPLNKIGLADSSCGHTDYKFDHWELRRWGYVYFFVKIPRNIQDGDKITLDLWNIGKEDIYMDDICLELYKER